MPAGCDLTINFSHNFKGGLALKNNARKVLSMLLTLVMVFSLLPTAAFADDTTPTPTFKINAKDSAIASDGTVTFYVEVEPSDETYSYYWKVGYGSDSLRLANAEELSPETYRTSNFSFNVNKLKLADKDITSFKCQCFVKNSAETETLLKSNIAYINQGFTIVYESSVYVDDTSYKKTYEKTDDDYTLPAPEANGYTFGGWYDNAAFEGDAVTVLKCSDENGNKTFYAKWTEDEYIISWNGNGADTTGEEFKKTYKVSDETYTLPIPSKDKAVFEGWYTTKKCVEGTEVTSIPTGSSGNKEFTAKWSDEEYVILYELNGGERGSETYVESYKSGEKVNLPTAPTRTGYEFKGWFYNADLTGEAVTEIADTDSGDKKFYAKWDEIKYTIGFDANDTSAKGSMDAMTGIGYNETVTLTENAFDLAGYVFKGWNTKADGSGTAYDDKAKVTALSSIKDSTVTLYAQWEKLEGYSIVFEAPDATGGSMTSMSGLDPKVNYTLKKNEFEKTGYRFKCWEDEDGKTYLDGASIYALADACEEVVLTAKFEECSYKIEFKANEPEEYKDMATGSMDGVVVSYSKNFTLTANAFKLEGYHFVSWNTKADGTGTSYNDKQIVNKLASQDDVTITLYAQWAPNGYTVKFDANGGTGEAMADQSFEYDAAQKLTKCAYTKAGYEFAGWTTNQNGSGTHYKDEIEVKNITTGQDAVITLYAQWTDGTIEVQFDANGGTGSMDPIKDVRTSRRYTLTKNAFVYDGYKFKEWNTMADGSGISYKDGASFIGSAFAGETITILYAQWEEKTYTVKYNANGGTGTVPGPDKDIAGSYIYIIQPGDSLSRTGYVFDGWNTAKDGSGTSYSVGESVKGLSDTDKATVTLYAQWLLNKYDIEFDANGGTGSMSPMLKLKYGTNYNLTANTFENEGFTFKGWNTMSDGSGAAYKDGAKVKNLTGEYGGTVTLYAQWDECKYIIAFKSNGGSGTVASIKNVSYDQDVNLPAGDGFKRTGYKFTGWNTKADGSGESYAVNEEVSGLTKVNGETVYMYAQWAGAEYKIVFEGNGADEGYMASETGVDVNTSITLEANAFSRKGYTFAGWNTRADGKGTSYKDGATVKGLSSEDGATVTLYAKWTANKYTVAFNGNGSTSGSMSSKTGLAYDATYTVKSNTFKKTGCDFRGWTVIPDDDEYLSASINIADYADYAKDGVITLYAAWSTPGDYTIIYDPNVTEFTAVSDVLSADEVATIKANMFNFDGHTFKSWNTKANGKGTTYNAGDKIDSSKGSTIRLYAQWNEHSYTVKYNANGGSGSASSKTVKYSTLFKLDTGKNFKRTGYTFAGWNTEADGTGKSYESAAAVYGLSKDNGATVTLYAQWASGTYTIQYERNYDSKGYFTSDPEDIPTNKEYAIEAPDVDRLGYTFTGWNTKANGKGTSYTVGQKVTGLKADGETLILYAQWSENKYTVQYNANGGTGSAASKTLKYTQLYTVNKGTGFKRSGFEFAGWNTEPDGLGDSYDAGTKYSMLSPTNGAVVTLYAKWTSGEYDVVYYANNDTTDSSSVTAYTGEAYTIDTCDFEWEGRTFKSWNTLESGLGKEYKPGTKVTGVVGEGETFELYAQWTESKYSVVYNGNGSTSGSMTTRTGVKYSDSFTLTANVFKRDGYEFLGWSFYPEDVEEDLVDRDSVDMKDLADYAVNGTVTLYAVWEETDYNIVYYANNGTEEYETATGILYTKSYTLDENEFERTGYTFSSWNTKADGTGTKYTNCQSVSKLSKDGSDVKLYAQWTKTTYTVIYEPNGGNGTMTSKTVKIGDTLTLPKCSFTDPSMTFAGWKIGDGETTYAAGNTVPINEAICQSDSAVIVVTALWT